MQGRGYVSGGLKVSGAGSSSSPYHGLQVAAWSGLQGGESLVELGPLGLGRLDACSHTSIPAAYLRSLVVYYLSPHVYHNNVIILLSASWLFGLSGYIFNKNELIGVSARKKCMVSNPSVCFVSRLS